jgi:hypothetical protein
MWASAAASITASASLAHLQGQVALATLFIRFPFELVGTGSAARLLPTPPPILLAELRQGWRKESQVVSLPERAIHPRLERSGHEAGLTLFSQVPLA